MQVAPTDTLTVIIEAAAALAGFAGIVVTLRRSAWTRLDTLQIRNLLSSAFSALFVSITALILIHAAVPEKTTWAIMSAVWFIVGVMATTQNAMAYRELATQIEEPFPSKSNLFWFGSVLLVLILQIYNALVLQAFWPVLIGVSWLFGLTCYSFWELLKRHE